MKNYTLLLLLLIAGNLFSQTQETITYKNGIAFNFEALVVKDLKLTYSHRIDEDTYLETMLSYNLPSGIVNLTFFGPKDPFYYYNRVQLRAGYKKYLTNKFYISSMLSYSYGHFNREAVWYGKETYGYYVSRIKNEFEFILKPGWTYQRSHVLQDFYLGIGFKHKIFNDVVKDVVYAESNSDEEGNPYNPVTHPFHRKSQISRFTIHLGYQIGYCK